MGSSSGKNNQSVFIPKVGLIEDVKLHFPWTSNTQKYREFPEVFVEFVYSNHKGTVSLGDLEVLRSAAGRNCQVLGFSSEGFKSFTVVLFLLGWLANSNRYCCAFRYSLKEGLMKRLNFLL